MRLYSENEHYKLYHGDMSDMLDVIERGSITSIVTDPPYELGFMNRQWDKTGIAFNAEAWRKCLDVLKPGGHLVAFCGSRTFHRMVCAIEDAGFEIRDVVMWLYGSGMPKSSNVGKMLEKKLGHPVDDEFYKYGNALKPAYEPIVIARKPFEGSMLENMYNNHAGALNIDDCRVPITDDGDMSGYRRFEDMNARGRFPANVILTYNDDDYDDVCGGFPQSGSASRYFYCAKASRQDRDDGLEDFELVTRSDRNPNLRTANNQFNRSGVPRKNFHPTCKPTELMRYLVRLVTPDGGVVLDCFNGSGSTGKAVMSENRDRNSGYRYIGIEMTEEYLPLAKARIEHVINDGLEKDVKPKNWKKPSTEPETKQEETLW